MALKSNDSSAGKLRFTPPKAEKLPRYASYGSGQMKTHTEIGHAKQSLGHRCAHVDYNSDLPYYQRPTLWREGFILELVDGEWYVRYHVLEGTNDDDLPWKVDAWKYGGSSYWHSRYMYSEPSYKPEEYTKVRINRPETKEEYAAWRVAVELEKRGIEA